MNRPLVVFYIAARRLAAEPFAHEPGVAAGALGQFLWRDRFAVGHRAVQAQFLTEDHVGHDGGPTHVVDELAHEFVKLGLVHHRVSLRGQDDWSARVARIAAAARTVRCRTRIFLR